MLLFPRVTRSALVVGKYVAPHSRRNSLHLRSFFGRGLDDQSFRDKEAKCLVEDFHLESEKQREYFKNLAPMREAEEKAQREVSMREHLPPEEMLTEAEKQVLDDTFGLAHVENWIQKIERKCNYSNRDIIVEKLRFVERAKQASSLHSLLGTPTADFKSFYAARMDKHIERLPPVDVAKDVFPANEAVIGQYQEWKNYLEQIMPTCGHQIHSLINLPGILRSPFGPVPSSSSNEELSNLQTVNLRSLLKDGIALEVPRSKMFLTVVTEALVSPSLVVSMIVQDGDGQCVMLQIFKMKNLKPTISGLEDFPVGSRFCLKNPFLKTGIDGWPLLRVDQPFDLQRLDVPPLQGSIMILGDGDFSFSVALARENNSRGSAAITATSPESPEFVETTYSKGKNNLAELNSIPSVTIYHEVDATLIHKNTELQKYDSIVWNFPYPRDKTVGTFLGTEGGKLAFTFLESARECLEKGGRIFVSLASHQGGTTREASAPKLAWDMEEQAHKAGLDIVDVLPFDLEGYHGYQPTRSYEDSTFPSCNARVHILKIKGETSPGEEPSFWCSLSSLASYTIDHLYGWLDRGHHFISPDAAIQSLESDRHRSKLASDLYQSAKTFKEVLSLLPKLDEEAMDLSKMSHLRLSVTRLVDLLDEIFLARDGLLVVQWKILDLMIVYERLSLYLIWLMEEVGAGGKSIPKGGSPSRLLVHYRGSIVCPET